MKGILRAPNESGARMSLPKKGKLIDLSRNTDNYPALSLIETLHGNDHNDTDTCIRVPDHLAMDHRFCFPWLRPLLFEAYFA